ncbi:MAG: pyridoxal-phosphate dependent enzyme [Bradymonadia bacterium]
MYAATLEDIRAARARIAGHAHVTPVMTCAALDALAHRSLFFKCEHLQKVGAFKFRGAVNALSKLKEAPGPTPEAVVTHSSGNHAQAVALAGRTLGFEAHIVMPTSAPTVKRQAVEGYGARVYPCAPVLEARESTAAQVVAETGGVLIPPYNHPDVIAGQGTIALELLEQVADLDAVIVPVGGGGMISGIALALREAAPHVRVFAAEPLGADDAARSKAAGRLIPQTGPDTIADGLLTSLGDLTWPVIRDVVEQVITVSEAAIVEAMSLVWSRMKQVVEPSAAVSLAAALSDEFRAISGVKRVALVLCGGNVDLSALPWG